MLVLTTSACGPALFEQKEFTPRFVRDIRFEDSCELQPYFNSNPPALVPETETAVSGSKPGVSVGKATYVLEGVHVKMLAILLDNFYIRVPKFNPAKPMSVTVQYVERHKAGGQRHVPIGARFQLESGAGDLDLPYHPCLAAFVYGRKYYAMRGRMMQQQARVSLP